MNSKKIIKVLTMIIVTIAIISMAANCFALTPGEMKGTEPTDSGIDTMGKKLIGILQTVGVVLSVIVLIILGIKYMMGSAEEKAEYKKTMIPYLVGACLIFAASSVAQVIYSFFTGMATGA